MKDTLILGIESSCDETACSVVRNGREILSNIIASQADFHEQYGGVVPELASRMHLDAVYPTIKEALEKADVTLSDIDAVAVTYGPGLVGALLVGLSAAKGLCLTSGKPLVGVNHLLGHICANYLCFPELEPPFLCLCVSGGNTQIIHVKDYTDLEIIGKTRDDAAGEAIDKIARVVGLGYPGGPKMDSDMDILNMVADSLQAGGHGVSIGRNVFQHRDVQGVMSAISDICLKGFTAKEAFEAHLQH